MAFDTTTDEVDTPKTRYYKLKGDFRKIYLNPAAWNHEYGSKQSIQAYHDLLYYLKITEQFRSQSRALSIDVPSDNIYLVSHELPFPEKLYEELIDYVVTGITGKPWEENQEEQLDKIKEYFEMKKRGNLNSYRVFRNDCKKV